MVLETPKLKKEMSAQETYHALLMEYASGCLDEAQALIVATHMSLSPYARKLVAEYESIGGSMLKDCCTPVAMKSDALKCVMDKLEQVAAPVKSCTEKLACKGKDYGNMPLCLESYMETRTWKDSGGGTHSIHVKTTCCGYSAQLMKMKPDLPVTPPTHDKHELTVVLEGTFTDGTMLYKRGDLIIVEKNSPVRLRTDAQNGVICFVVKPAQSRVRKWAGQILLRFHPKD